MKPWIDTFNELHIPEPMSGCWLWIGAADNHGYGHMGRLINNKAVCILAHRFSWEHHYGQLIPVGMCVLHKCDVPACVNPYHLFLGTQQDNMDDCKKKGRGTSGVTNSHCKLTEGDVKAIREAIGTHLEIGKRFNIGPSQVGKIRARQSWTHI